jgi:tRNA(fMet)-specific endonuclease VapC
MLVLDTDHMTFLGWRKREDTSLRLRHLLDQRVGEPFGTTIVTYEEQCRGWLAFIAKAKTITNQIKAYERLAIHADVYRNVMILDFDVSAATIFRHLKQARLGVGTQDLRIAAITLVHNATLLSRNLKDFEKVPGLRVEDWTV